MKMIIAANHFLKVKKKGSKKLQLAIDEWVKAIVNDTDLGDEKKGDLKGIRVAKFNFGKHLYLLSYEVKDDTLFLYAVGSHENYYKKLKRQLKKK